MDDSKGKDAADKPEVVYLKNYRKPDYLVPEIALRFEVAQGLTTVISSFIVQRNEGVPANTPLELDGEKIELQKISLNGEALTSNRYKLSAKKLIIFEMPERATLLITTTFNPDENYSASGLYRSGPILCTQMEAQGFRRVTFFLDRPDVLAKYTTTIVADPKRFPVLLSNGNLVADILLPDGRREVTFVDPFPKPSYLFALVAGELGVFCDSFVTKSGCTVKLEIYVERGEEALCAHAMNSLIKAMRWEEDTFGLEYDLDNFKIVAVKDFNAGAMENKGLNIFEASYILADADSATDDDFLDIESIVAHEYLHNWSGNRVTCRDWFQLTLKEGLTILRDQFFTADQYSAAVKRINDVRIIRDDQFQEARGPNSHPIRPESYIEIENFYTITIYEKGAEVIRMIDTLIGRKYFKLGLKKYFELYDGQAVTTEDFLHAMAIVSGRDFTQFKNWYSRSATPKIKVSSHYDAKAKTYELTLKQSCEANKEGDTYNPFHIPFNVGLVGKDGADLALRLTGESADKALATRTLELTQSIQSFRFVEVPASPIPSLLRNFSAPVEIEYPYSEEELIFLLQHDSDAFNRYDAGQNLAHLTIQKIIKDLTKGIAPNIDTKTVTAFGKLISDESLDPAFRAELLTLPSIGSIADKMKCLDYELALRAKEILSLEIAGQFKDELTQVYRTLEVKLGKQYKRDSAALGMRTLKNNCFSYLIKFRDAASIQFAFEQFSNASNMTDRSAALDALIETPSKQREIALKEFYDRWKGNSVVIGKWFSAQASDYRTGTVESIDRLSRDAAFESKNPSHLHYLYGAFAWNLIQFHHRSGSGYSFIANKILELDKFNPKAAANLATAYLEFERVDVKRRALMQRELERIIAESKLSPAVFEIVSNTLS